MATFALRRTGYRRPMVDGFVLAALGLLLLACPPRRRLALRCGWRSRRR